MAPAPLSNTEIADRLASLAQLLSAQNENPYKVRAYQRAAARIRILGESVDELVRDEADLTAYAGIGKAIASAIREIVLTGSLRKLDDLRASAPSELAGISLHPRLDPKRVLRVFKKLNIATIDALREKLESGDIERSLGVRMAQHVRQGLTETRAMLLYRADDLHSAIQEFLLRKCGAGRVEAVGDYRRRVEVIDELDYIVETDHFTGVIAQVQRYGGGAPLVSSSEREGLFALSAGILLRVRAAVKRQWGLALIACTGSKAHLRKLVHVTGSLKHVAEKYHCPTESAVYKQFGLAYIPPELREGNDEVERAVRGTLPRLVKLEDIRGELHAHSTSSDGSHSVAQMAAAAEKQGYDYIGITDHSQSLKIARGVSIEDLWQQIRLIDKLNERGAFRVLKSAEVDIAADGSLDYPDDLLRELDYTVCSIHSRFGLGRHAQTERIMRAMDNRYFNILGHATGRLLLKRPGYELDMDRIIEHARQNRCFFEVNSSPDRLDLSAANARAAARAGVQIAISTDAHSTREFQLIRYGLDQARRAGLTKNDVLNCFAWEKLRPLFLR